MLRPLSFSFILFFFLLSAFIVEGHVEHYKVKKPSTHENVIENRYTVELSHPNDVLYFTDALSNAFAPQHIKIHRQFIHSVFNGVSFRLISSSPDRRSQHHQVLQSLFNDESVLAVYPSQRVSSPSLVRPTVQHVAAGVNSSVSKLLSPHRLTQVDWVHKDLKYTGKDIIIGVIDTGVDYIHPALGGGFGKGFKVRYGEDLVGDKYNPSDDDPIIKPGPTPLENCDASTGAPGHGTHVSGIIAGKTDNFTGVAPDATLAVWRVFGCTGGTDDDVIIEALLKAEKAGCDIINLSLGDSSGWSESPTAVVASRIAKRGIHMVIAAGNDGLNGAFTVGSPSTGDNTLSVASFDNENVLVSHFKASHVKDKIAFAIPSSTKIKTYPSGELVPGDDNDGFLGAGCTVPASVKGKYALVEEGSCHVAKKVHNLANAGALGMVVYKNSSKVMYSPRIDNATIPVMGISVTYGETLMDQLDDDKTVELKFIGQLPLPLLTANTVSVFSSVGASYELDFRPHISGVGGSIYSTLPRKLGYWGTLSGTSMATPYVAGSIALYLNSLGKNYTMASNTVLEHFQNYAYKAPLAHGPKGLDSPLRQGAGLIQVYDTITQKVHVSPGSISFNDTASNNYKTHTLTIMNYGDTLVSYQISNNATLAILPYDVAEDGYTYLEPINYTSATAKLRLSKKSIKVAPGKSIQVKVTVIPPDVDPKKHIMYGGYVQFKSRNHKSSHDISVPYFGLVGKQKDLPVFDLNTPFITSDNSTVVYDKHDTLTIQRSNNDTDLAPQLSFRLLTGTRLVKVELLEHGSGKVIGDIAPPLTYLPRNTLTTKQLIYSLILDGYYYPKGNNTNAEKADNKDDDDNGVYIPLGTYKIRVQALHLFGDPQKSDDFQAWESGSIKIVE
ncbi:unnamed protein product [Absidia cylindrospora]